MRSLTRAASGLIRACHPEPTAAVTLGSAVLAVAVGRTAIGVLYVAVAVLATQLAVGWSNDWLDAGRDEQVGRFDKPIARGLVGRRTVGIGSLVAGIAVVPLALLSGPPAALALIVGLCGGLAYNWPLKFTVLSVLPYLISFGALAAFVELGLPGPPVPRWWLVCAAGLLGAGAHFVNVLPDLADDARTGVRGLPHRLGWTGSWIAAGALLLGATAALAFGAGRPALPEGATVVVVAAILPVGWWRARRAGSRAAFRAVLAIALIDVILLLASGRRG
jgi:protoheme IX farnesyltransferase